MRQSLNTKVSQRAPNMGAHKSPPACDNHHRADLIKCCFFLRTYFSFFFLWEHAFLSCCGGQKEGRIRWCVQEALTSWATPTPCCWWWLFDWIRRRSRAAGGLPVRFLAVVHAHTDTQPAKPPHSSSSSWGASRGRARHVWYMVITWPARAKTTRRRRGSAAHQRSTPGPSSVRSVPGRPHTAGGRRHRRLETMRNGTLILDTHHRAPS